MTVSVPLTCDVYAWKCIVVSRSKRNMLFNWCNIVISCGQLSSLKYLPFSWLFSSPELKAQSILGWWESFFFQMKTTHFFKGRQLRNCKNTFPKFKIFFRTIWLISTKLGTKHPLMKELKVYKQRPFNNQKEDDGFLPFKSMLYYIIIALSKCVYWNNLVSKMSDVAHGPLVYSFDMRSTRIMTLPILQWRPSSSPDISSNVKYPITTIITPYKSALAQHPVTFTIIPQQICPWPTSNDIHHHPPTNLPIPNIQC